MRYSLSVLALFFGICFAQSQVVYEQFDSHKLGEKRELKIQLPRNYDDDPDQSYPLFVVLDGDYMFEIVAGNVDYYSYWEDMPDAIVVGVNQVETRDQDTYYSEQNSMPMDSGAQFFEFISMELLPYMVSNYRLAEFRVAVGHGETANFINYYLLKNQPLFHAYINISPTYAPDLFEFLPERVQQIQQKTFYYLATSKDDVKSIKTGVDEMHQRLSAIDNKSFLYEFDSFEGPSHYSNPAHAIPSALESIFFVFQPISKKEYKERILTLETSPVAYLEEKYKMIEELFGFEKQIVVNDFRAIAAVIEKKELYEEFEALGKIARKEYPDTVLGHYFLGRFYEETGKPKKAMKTYRSAYILEEIGGYTKDQMLRRADAIKNDFGN